MVDFTDPIYTDANAAREHMEMLHWPHGPACPRCGNVDQDRITRMQGKSHRPGVYQCNECRKPFSVTVGTVFEDSKIPLNKWVLATHLMASSKKGFSAHQLHRTLGVTYKTAWFMAHRIRLAMEPTETPPLGSNGGTVEVDETFIGRLEGQPKKRHGGTTTYKNTVFALVERGGSARVFHVEGTTAGELIPIIRANVASGATVFTDEGSWYRPLGQHFTHEVVNHSRKEYVRGKIHTNTVEGYFGVFKRGMKGVYQHCAEKHLHRYLAEFEFRYNNRIALGVNDTQRAERILKGADGKRLTYRRIDEARL
jgi:transposase-like protein